MPFALPKPAAGSSTKPKVSLRSSEIKPFEVMEVLRAAADLESRSTPTSPKVLHLEIGQPSASAPSSVTEAAIAALRLPPHQQGYTPAVGLPELRSRLASLYSSRNSLPISPEHIVVTTGSSAAFVALFAVLFDPGDRVAVAIPGYPCYRHVLRALSVSVVPLPVTAETNYQPTLSQLREAHEEAPLSGMIVASPANPTGAVLSASRLSELAVWTAAEGVRLVADEIYHGIVREPAPTAAAFEHAIVVSSFSKFWCMPGFRIGWIVVKCAQTRAPLENALQNMNICAPTVAQHAAIAALGDECLPELQGHVRRYLTAADALVETLRETGFEDVRKPDGAFYVYVDCREVCRRVGAHGSKELCKMLLERAAVAVTPGTDFDPERGNQFVRFSCAGSSEDIKEAGRRILRLVREVSGG